MKRVARVVQLSLAVVAASVFACGGDDDGDDGGATVPDGGSDDAGGLDAGPAADGGGDAGADASPDAAPATVTLTFLSPQGPVSGADVIFLSAADSLIAAGVTGIDGRASARFDGTGKVVLHYRAQPSGAHEVQAWLSVPPGSDVVFDLRDGPGADSATLIVDGPTAAGADRYRVDTPCGSATSAANTPEVSVALAGCSPTIHLLWTALDLDPISGELATLSTAFEPEVELAAGRHTVTADLAPLAPVTAELTGIPADVNRARLQYDLRGAYGLIMAGPSVLETPVAGSVKTIVDLLDLADLPAVSGQFDVQLERDGIGVIDVHARADHVRAPVLAAGELLPAVRNPAFDAAARRFTWVEQGSGAASAVVATALLDTVPPITWQAVGPHQSEELILPLLPPPFDELNPGPDLIVGAREITLYQHPGGYDRFRADLRAAIDPDRIAPGQRLLRSRHAPNPLPLP